MPGIEFAIGRERPANYIAICGNITDGYPDGIPHGVQKDFVQNAMDAVKGKGPVNVEFALIHNERGRFLSMRDSNTIGLTGPVLSERDAYEDELPEDYHWARFESFAFTKSDPDAIGARGQGKFVFLAASKKHTMFYDTLRNADSLYRVGATQARSTGCPILPSPQEEPWENQRGADLIKQECGLEPLKEPGTRVIVVEPIEELVHAIVSGIFLRAIQETWFRAIEKERLVARVHDGKSWHSVGLPSPFPLPRLDNEASKSWLLGKDTLNKTFRLATGETYDIKHFHAVYLNVGTVPEDMRGIAIIHNGMKICCEEARLFPPQARERLVGYIEFDRKLDQELRKGENQNPNHYDLKWRRRIPQAIRAYIQEQLDAFGKRKLGLGLDPRERKRRERVAAEEWAMRQLMRHARDLDLFGRRGGPEPPPPPPPPPPSPVKLIGVAITDFSFPDPEISPRVNYGQTLSGIRLAVFNKMQTQKAVSLDLRVLYASSSILDLIEDQRFQVVPESQDVFGPFKIAIEESIFQEPGEYRLKARILDATTGARIDEVSRRFWVEQDPPFRKPFDLVGAPEFQEPNAHLQWLPYGTINRSPTIYYNTAHPAYRFAESDDESHRDYLFRVALEGAIFFILDRPDTPEGESDYHPLSAEAILGPQESHEKDVVPKETHTEVQRYVSEIYWRMFEGE